MKEKVYQYDAFISYRHLPADKAAAERLQQLLERHKGSDGKPLRIFRDQSELPTSGDLGSDIRKAVEESRFLVVIASPSYRESKWCMAELDYFRSLHGNTNKNILPLLVEGEPEEAFPECLRWENRSVTDSDGSIRILREEVEPLGADIRAEALSKQLKLLKTEYLRIAAPILGCGFDDLYQRAQRQRRNQIVGIISGVAVLAVAFSIYSLYMLNQIKTRQALLEAKQEELYANESRRLGNEAMGLLSDNPDLAMLLADTALPESLESPEYPIQPEAELAVRSAALDAQIQQLSHGVRLIATVEFATITQNYNGGFLGFFDEGRCFAMYDTNHTWILDAATGQVLTTLDGWSTITLSGDAATYLEIVQAKEGDSYQVLGYLYDSYTKELLGSQLIAEDPVPFPSCLVQYDNGRFYLMAQQNVNTYTAYGYFTPDGQYTVSDALPTIIAPGTSYTMEKSPDDFALAVEDGKVWAVFEEIFSPTYQVDSIYTTYDGRLYFVHISNADGSTVLLWAAEEEKFLGFSQGTCFQSGDNHLFYSMDNDELRIYAYYPESFPQVLYRETEFDCISSDGSRVAIYENPTLMIYDSDDLTSPLFSKECSKYRLTSDLAYVFIKTKDDRLQVYAVATGELLLELEATVHYNWAMGLKEDGSLAAVSDPGTGTISVYDLAAGQCIHGYTFQSTGVMFYLEFYGNSLAACSDYESYLFDLDDFANPVNIQHAYTDSVGFIDSFPMATAWDQEAGLLVIPGVETSAYGDRWRVCAILDVNAGTSLSYHNRYDTGLERFCYDPVSHTLFDQQTNEVIAHRRTENGDFEEVYRFTTQDSTAELLPFASSCDGQYLVLNGQTQTEIYDVADGTLLFVLPHGDFHTPSYGVAGGVLYDLNGGGDAIASYALPDMETARQMVQQYLAEGGQHRSFSQEELEEYYIPEEWA